MEKVVAHFARLPACIDVLLGVIVDSTRSMLLRKRHGALAKISTSSSQSKQVNVRSLRISWGKLSHQIDHMFPQWKEISRSIKRSLL